MNATYILSALLMSERGPLVSDPLQSYALLEAAAERRHSFAEWALGHTLCTGESEMVAQDIQRGLELLERSAQTGCDQAQWLLGKWYIHGVMLGGSDSPSIAREVHANFEKACKLLKAAAEQGHAEAEKWLMELDVSKYRIAKPANVRKGEARARIRLYLPWLLGPEARAEHGDLEAQFEVGNRLVKEEGDEVLYDEGCYLLRKAAHAGNHLAINKLAALEKEKTNQMYQEKKRTHPVHGRTCMY